MSTYSERPVKIGVAIAAFNRKKLLLECLHFLMKSSGVNNLFVAVLDDGSNDGSFEALLETFPGRVAVARGDGNFWWTGGTNVAVAMCLGAQCDYVLLLNPDVVVTTAQIDGLVERSIREDIPIIAPVVVSVHDSECVVWAGSRWAPIHPLLPFIWVSRYLVRQGVSTRDLPDAYYATSEVHGRAVLVRSDVFRRVGMHDQVRLPHYGADTEFSFRCGMAGVKMAIDPHVRVMLHDDNSGMRDMKSFRAYWAYLTRRKNGEALRVWWQVLTRSLPWYQAIPTYCFILSLNTFRYWCGRCRKYGSF